MKLALKKPKLSRRSAKILIACVVAIFALPFIALHVLAYGFSMHDRKMQPYTMETLKDAKGHRLRYYELKQPGAGWNIIFIHGTPGSASAFIAQFRNPYPGANLIAFDRPGFGGSGPALRKPSLADQATAVEAFLSKTNGRHTILVGHSYGAPVALVAALKYTNEVAGVLLIGGSVDPGQEHVEAIQWIGNIPPISWLIPGSLRQCNRELLTLKRDLLKLKPEIKSLGVPVEMLHGSKDKLVPIENIAYLKAQLDAAGKGALFDTLTFTNYNHFIPWEHPDAVKEALSKLITHIQQSQQVSSAK